MAVYATRPKPEHLSEEQYRQFLANSGYLWDHLAEVPVILIACLDQARAAGARQPAGGRPGAL